MKMLKNGKILEKISIIDVLVVFILIFVVISVVAKYKSVSSESNTQTNTSSINFEYTVKFENVRSTSGEMLLPGDVVFDKVSGTEIGKIADISIQPTILLIETMTGEVVNREYEDRVDIIVTIETKGSIKNSEYMANDLIRILIGKTLEINTKYVTISGVITDIKKIEN